MTLTAASPRLEPLIDLYRAHVTNMPVHTDYQRQLVVAGERFLAEHPDLDEWMRQSPQARVVELGRQPNAWPVLVFAMVSGRCRADLDFLVAKRFGHSAGRTVAILHAGDVIRLRGAARRLGRSPAVFKELLGRTIPLVVCAFGVACRRSATSSSTSSPNS